MVTSYHINNKIIKIIIMIMMITKVIVIITYGASSRT